LPALVGQQSLFETILVKGSLHKSAVDKKIPIEKSFIFNRPYKSATQR
jgi:hypothetical protein